MKKARPTLPLLLLAVSALVLSQIRPAVSADEANGTITGIVHFKGTPPPPTKMQIDKDNDVCGSGFRKQIDVDVGRDKSLHNVVICVEGDGKGSHFEPPAGGFKLDQKGCAFVPEIMIVPAGEKLRITNRDPVVHNIHTFEIIKGIRRDMFNFAQPERGHRRTETIKPRRSNTVELTCDIHTFMHGWMYVSDGSACIVSKDGRFRISDVAEGVHTVKVWHPTLGEKKATAVVKGAQETTVEFEFAAKN